MDCSIVTHYNVTNSLTDNACYPSFLQRGPLLDEPKYDLFVCGQVGYFDVLSWLARWPKPCGLVMISHIGPHSK